LEPLRGDAEYSPLSTAQYEEVTQSVSELSRFSKHIRDAPRQPHEPYWTLSPSEVGKLRDMRENATKAFNALAAIARDNEVPSGKLLHEDQQPT
jgi:hypothetical protein